MTTPDKPTQKKPAPLKFLWKEYLEPAVFAIVVTQFIATLVGVDGNSMMPNLSNRDRVFVPKYETWLHKAGIGNFSRGDILIFKPPGNSGLNRTLLGWTWRPFLIKRLIGLPGDKISVSAGEVTINGKKLNSNWTTDYWRAQGCWDTESEIANNASSSVLKTQELKQEITVPKGYYFVMGDNRNVTGSEDSRMFGAVPMRDIAGRAAFIMWPIMRKSETKYDCLNNTITSTSGENKLNWRVLGIPDAFEDIK